MVLVLLAVIDPSCSLPLNMAQSEGILRRLITEEDTNTEVEELGLALWELRGLPMLVTTICKEVAVIEMSDVWHSLLVMHFLSNYLHISCENSLTWTDLPLVSSSWSFSSSRAFASCSWEVPVCSTDCRRHWMKRSRKSVPLLGSSATNLSTFAAWVVGSVNSSWKSAVIRWYSLRYGRRLGTFSSLLNLTWHFRRTLSPTEPPSERWNRCYYTVIGS